MLQSCILPVIGGHKDISRSQGKDDKDSNEVQEREEVELCNELVDKEGQWEAQDDLCQSDESDEGTACMDDNGDTHHKGRSHC